MTLKFRPPLALAALLLASCAGEASQPADPPRFALEGTRWRLLEISPADAPQGPMRPRDPALYTLDLGADGRAALRLDCNRGGGVWSATPAPGGTSGEIAFSALAMTRAFCPPPSLDVQLAAALSTAQRYAAANGRLRLDLAAGGFILWAPTP